MNLRCSFCYLLAVSLAVIALWAQTPVPSSSSSSTPAQHSRSARNASFDAGVVSNGVYRNSALGFSCKIPAGWVLRTDEMNSHDDSKDDNNASAAPAQNAGKVLLAAFSRPPGARGEEINSSIVIAAESASVYPGLKDAAQYFGPLTEVAKAQGFSVVEEPYEFPVGGKALVRGDFQKDVGTRVMRQSTLAILTHGYAISFTFIGGSEDEVEELVDGLSFGAGGKAVK
jgi:hypothetical protein